MMEEWERDMKIRESKRDLEVLGLEGWVQDGQVCARVGNFRLSKYIGGGLWAADAVYGPGMPLEQAIALDERDYIGGGKVGTRVRVARHAGGADPMEWAEPHFSRMTPEQKDMVNGKTFGEIRGLVLEGSLNTKLYVGEYHIDNREGLGYFVQAVKALGEQ